MRERHGASSRGKSKPRTALCTIATGPHIHLFELARPGFELFSAANGYELVVVHDEMISAGRAPSWGKVVLLRELLEVYERVAWVDTDVVIVDPTSDICVGLNRRKPLRLVFHHYDGLEVPNAGVFAIKSCWWSKRFLTKLWNAERFIDHKWWENAAIIELLGYDVEAPRRSTRRNTFDGRRVGELDLSWNSIPGDSSPAPHIVHFPGMTQAERLISMTAAAKVAALSFGVERSPATSLSITADAVGARGLALLTRGHGSRWNFWWHIDSIWRWMFRKPK